MVDDIDLKYRPQFFEELVGQQHIASFLSSRIQHRAGSHKVILHGPFGAGKTSAARIYARALNCSSVTSNGSPCNDCTNCRAFLLDEFPDFLEYNGAELFGSYKQQVDISA